MNPTPSPPPQQQSTRVWDLPTRLFHWSLLACVVGCFACAKVGGDAMRWHFYFGYAVLILLIFRIVWGFVGNRYARFASFLPNPLAALRTLKGGAAPHLGHNPLGAFSVYALLGALAFQACSGLFSNDDIASEGPWMVKVSKELSDQITSWHKINEKIIIVLVLLHIAALIYHRVVKKERLVAAMVTGDKSAPISADAAQTLAAQDHAALRWRGLAVLLAAAGAVWVLVNKV